MTESYPFVAWSTLSIHRVLQYHIPVFIWGDTISLGNTDRPSQILDHSEYGFNTIWSTKSVFSTISGRIIPHKEHGCTMNNYSSMSTDIRSTSFFPHRVEFLIILFPQRAEFSAASCGYVYKIQGGALLGLIERNYGREWVYNMIDGLSTTW